MAYIPTKDADVVSWGDNFAALITAAPATYGLLTADAVLIQTNFDQFEAAYALAVAPSTRTIATVADKDEQKAGFLSLARSYAAIIRANQGVSNENKAALGLNIPDPTPTPVPPPSSVPVLAIPLFGPSGHYMTITDQFSPTAKKKPEGAAGCILYRKTGATPAVNMDGALVVGLFTRSDQLVSTAGLTPGQYASYAAQWYNRKGQIGPMGDIASAIIA